MEYQLNNPESEHFGLIVRFGIEGSIWTWTDNGQRTLCRSDQAQEFVLAHTVGQTQDDMLRVCRDPELRQWKAYSWDRKWKEAG